MPSLQLLATFFVTTLVFAYIPGPAMLYAAARTMAGGRRAGLMAALGIHLGCYAHVALSAAGLTFLLTTVPALYMAVKLVGAAYLVWLGIGMLRARAMPAVAENAPARARHPGAAFGESMLVEILNPKTAIFFLAFLPQFVDPLAGLPVWLQLAVLGTVVNLTFTSADIVCVLLAGAIMARLRGSQRAGRLLARAGGALLVGLGVHLVLQRS